MKKYIPLPTHDIKKMMEIFMRDLKINLVDSKK